MMVRMVMVRRGGGEVCFLEVKRVEEVDFKLGEKRLFN